MIEREFKRHIPDQVLDDDIISAIGKAYAAGRVVREEIFDAYFKSALLPNGYVLRVRELDNELEPTLKGPAEIAEGGLLKRHEFKTMEDICQKLGILPSSNLTQFTRDLQTRYGLDLIIRQKRVKFFVDDVEISLDTLEYYYPIEKSIPPIKDATGKMYKKLRLYEVEIKNEQTKKSASEMTQYLYGQNLLGEVCTLSKKEIGHIF